MKSFQVNKINTDEFGRTHGVFAYNKPVGVSSHDIVYKFRRHFNTKKVGHAGTLDPFASGLLIILVGKATKLSDKFLNNDKEYKARILLGIETTSGDPEGDIVNASKEKVNIDLKDVSAKLQSFLPGYNQTVPLFSSVKVNGKKLRELARQYSKFKFNSNNEVEFFDINGKSMYKVTLPVKEVKIYNIELMDSGVLSKTQIVNTFNSVFGHKQMQLTEDDFPLNEYNYIDVLVSVSKGTYIRQLAIDIGKSLRIPASLVSLERTKVGDFSIENTYSID